MKSTLCKVWLAPISSHVLTWVDILDHFYHHRYSPLHCIGVLGNIFLGELSRVRNVGIISGSTHILSVNLVRRSPDGYRSAVRFLKL
jgi:hypothetical protein